MVEQERNVREIVQVIHNINATNGGTENK